MNSPELDQAIRSIESGNREQGRLQLFEYLKQEPTNKYAWLWLSSCFDTPQEKRKCLDKVLELDPNNQVAKNGLEKLTILELQQKTHNKNEIIQFIPAICPVCNGDLRVPNNRDVVKCLYCGHDVIIHDSAKVDVKMEIRVDISKPMELARIDEEAGNFEQSFIHYSQVLEQDPENSDAWFGKARSVANKRPATMASVQESVVYFEKAIRLDQNNIEQKQNTSDVIAFAAWVLTEIFMQSLAEIYNGRTANDPYDLDGFLGGFLYSRNQDNQILNTFQNDFFPCIFQILNFCWSVSPTESVANSVFYSCYRFIHPVSDKINYLSQPALYISSNLYNQVNQKFPKLLEETSKKKKHWWQ
jgi:tetratricopeptide (TPR) repeat protein